MSEVFEACMYNPSGTVRELKPITNSDMQNLSIPLMNVTTSKAISRDNAEIQAEELMVAYSCDDFYLTDTLYRVFIPTVDNMFAETACRLTGDDSGWERIRNGTIKRIMQFDSTIKLWDATRRRHPLFQQLPHTIFHGMDSDHFFKLRRLSIPTDLKTARREFRKIVKTGQDQMIGHDAENILKSWNFNLELRRRLMKGLLISSYVLPRAAINSRILGSVVKHSLRTELLHDLEVNAYSMGLIENSEDFRFCDIIRKFQEPTEKFLPLTFTTTYKTSLYAWCPKYITPARLWDSEPIKGMVKKDAAVEFSVVVRNLVTPWPRKFDGLHDFNHRIPIREVLPENIDASKIKVRRSDSMWAKISRGEPGIPVESEDFEYGWKGAKNFQETKIEERGLKLRKNALVES